MDALTSLLDGPRAASAFLLRSVLDPPWSLRIEDGAPLTVAAAVRGAAWILPDAADPLRLGAGDVAVVRGPDHYTVADELTTAPTVRIGPGQVCTDLAGNTVAMQPSLGTRTWGTSESGSTVLLTGTYQGLGEVCRRLLDALPPVIALPSGAPAVGLLADEIGRDALGQAAVLDRLLDLLLVTTLRSWFDRPSSAVPGWYAAHADPAVGQALRLMENDPGLPWTVGSLAHEVGMSRAALARRFAELVGEPPITFLTAHRLCLAADLLGEPGSTIGRVARQVGYGSPFTFSTAFKRHFGVSPQAHRRARADAEREVSIAPANIIKLD